MKILKEAMPSTIDFPSVYGPVRSWRYGQSLGIDPIGKISTCSFNCVYCQLGEIEHQTLERAIYVPTSSLLTELQQFRPWNVDLITLSGSGEPTLAANLGEILAGIKTITQRPVLVLTNGTLLGDINVRQELQQADRVSVKLDHINDNSLQHINRPVPTLTLTNLWEGIKRFRAIYQGELSIQTMILAPWNEKTIGDYSQWMRSLQPNLIQLNIPSRPKPQQRQLDGRENHNSERPYPVHNLKCIGQETLKKLAQTIQNKTNIPVTIPH